MCRAQYVLVVVALYTRVVHSWDIAVSVGDQLVFYNNGIPNTIRLKSHNLGALAYDAVNNMILYVDKQKDKNSICGYYISSMRNECFIKRSSRNINSLAYDLRTQVLFFTDTIENSINWISLKRGFRNNIYGNLLIKLDDGTPADIYVDGCKGKIYWINTNITNKYYLERARFDGSEREVSMFNHPIHSLDINPSKGEIYYFYGCNTCYTKSLKRADSNFLVEDVLYSGHLGDTKMPEELTISKDYIYWINIDKIYKTVWQLPKNAKRNEFEPIEIHKFRTDSTIGIAANYEIHDKIMDLQGCDSMPILTPNITIEPVYTDQRSDICENYCTQGSCSVNDAGLPTCSCYAGYTGVWCEVSACDGFCSNNGNCSFNEHSKPVCQCKGEHTGDRCELSACLNYCMQGNCVFNGDGHPTCSCNAGYTGKRCEVSVCHNYCLNDGDCSLNEMGKPVCQCVGDHEGTRCEVVKKNTLTVSDPSTYLSMQKNISLADLLSGGRKSIKISVNVDILVD